MREPKHQLASACDDCEALQGKNPKTPPHEHLFPINKQGSSADLKYFECEECGSIMLRDAERFGYGWMITRGEDVE